MSSRGGVNARARRAQRRESGARGESEANCAAGLSAQLEVKGTLVGWLSELTKVNEACLMDACEYACASTWICFAHSFESGTGEGRMVNVSANILELLYTQMGFETC